MTRAQPDHGTDDPAADDVFVTYRPNPRRWLAVAAALGAVLLLLIVLYSIRLTVFSPEAVLHAHFQALADRDLDAALEVTTTEAGEPVREGESELLHPAVLESEAYTPPTDLDVVEVEVDGRSARAQVDFTIGEQRHSTSLRLRRAEGTVDRFFHRWRILDAVRPLRMGDTPAEVSANGVPVLARELEGGRTLSAVFGGYEIGVPPDDPLWDSRTVTALVGTDQDQQVDVPMVARPEVQAEVDRQVTEILDRCAASTDLLPPDCPFGNARIAQAIDVAWRISSYPDIALEPGPDGLGGVAMLVRTTSEGEAVVTGVQQAFSLERPFEIVVPFPVDGVVTAHDGTITFEPSW